MSCPACAQPLPPGARFCPFCGEQVAARGVEERRLVTVLFADIVGSTGLVEFLDPERAKRVIDDAVRYLVADIVAFGGTLDKVLGDGVLAVFGAPIAHEDDADRAVRAGLAMPESLSRWAESTPEVSGAVALRVGINSGEVLFGSMGGSDAATVMGDVVNVASRLESLAPPNTVYVGDATAAMVSAAVELAPVDDLDVRGRAQRERVWRAVGHSTSRLPAPSRHRAPFLGRVDERRRLGDAVRAAAAGHGAALAVVGEPGIGKTRLVDEVLSQVGPGVTVMTGTCMPYGESNVWEPIATAMFGEIPTGATASPARLRELATEQGVATYGFDRDEPLLAWLAEGALHLAGHRSRFDEMTMAQQRETLFRLAIEALRRISAQRPLVLFIDDLQWADPLLIDLLGRLIRSLADRPFLLLTAQRDDAAVAWPPTSLGVDVTLMRLGPLGRAEADALIAALSEVAVSPSSADQLHRRSGGNPLYLTELTSMAPVDLPTGEVAELPGSLRLLIAARLDRLSAAARSVIDNAAVIGTSGPISSLVTFAAELGQDPPAPVLESVEIAGLLRVGPRGWRFRSDVVREVAYRTLTKVDRAQRHAGVARVMRSSSRSPVGREAHHTIRAAELVREIGRIDNVELDIVERAIAIGSVSARRSLDTGAYHQARRTAQRVLDLGVEDDATRRRLRLLRAEASVELREWDASRDDAQAALDAASAAGDLHDEALARRLLGVRAHASGELAEAIEHLDRAIAIARRIGQDRLLASALADRGFVEVFGGSLAVADGFLTEAEQLARRLGDVHARAWVHQHRALAAFMAGDAATASALIDRASATFDQLGDRGGLSWAQAIRAYLAYSERRLDDAEQIALEARAEALKLGERWAPAMMDSLLASIRLWTGDFVEAERLSRRALETFRELGDRFGRIQSLAPQVRSLVALGEFAAAERGVEEALAIADTSGTHALPVMIAAGALVHLGAGRRAVVVAEAALERVRATGAEGTEVRAALALALCQDGRPDEALAHLEASAGDGPYVHAVRALALALIGDHDSSIQNAARVEAAPGATHLDRLIAALAVVGARLGLGVPSALERAVDSVKAVARGSGDVVAVAVAAEVADRFDPRREAGLVARSAAPRRGTLGPGWALVLDALGERGAAPERTSMHA